MWVKISDDLYAQRPDPDPVQVVSAQELQAELDSLRVRLEGLPGAPSDEELLTWARANYPYYHDTSAERDFLVARISEITAILETE